MKPVISLLLLSAAVLRLGAQEAEPPPHPDTTFRLALQEIERGFVVGMRKLATQANTVRVYQIGEAKSECGLFSTAPEESVFTITESGMECGYNVIKAANQLKKREDIRAWAEAVLPAQSHPFAVCIPKPGFAVRFLNTEGKTVYATTICMKCQSAAIEYPRYSSRVGFDIAAMERLLTASGFTREELKAEPAGTGQPATRPVDEPEGGDKPQPEAEGRRP